MQFDSFGQNNMPFSRNQAGGPGGYELTYNPSVNKLFWYNSSFSKQESWSPQTNTWYHLAVVRSQGLLHFYANGIELGTGSVNTSNIVGDHPLYIGADKNANWGMNGKLDEFRISKIARWTSNFTPPVTAYPSDTSTNLLLHFDNQVKEALSAFSPKPSGKFGGECA